jgi:Rrf2 family protein
MRLELTKRADYAIRVVLALAEADDSERLSVRALAADRNVPAQVLPRVMTDLASAGIVDGRTGRTGGYRLARPAATVSLLDVIRAVEGDQRRRRCVLRGSACGIAAPCDVHEVFATAQDALLAELAQASIASIARTDGWGGLRGSNA